jgi:hypothetical protein
MPMICLLGPSHPLLADHGIKRRPAIAFSALFSGRSRSALGSDRTNASVRAPFLDLADRPAQRSSSAIDDPLVPAFDSAEMLLAVEQSLVVGFRHAVASPTASARRA